MVKNCLQCGRLFQTDNGNQKYCSEKCSHNAKLAKITENADQKKIEKKRQTNDRKKKGMNHLIETAKAANEAGMSYGQYVAKYGK